MKLFYKDDNDKLRFVSNPNSINEALQDINVYIKELNPNFRIPYKRLGFEEDKICIDTGCGKYPNAVLTAIILPEERFVTS